MQRISAPACPPGESPAFDRAHAEVRPGRDWGVKTYRFSQILHAEFAEIRKIRVNPRSLSSVLPGRYLCPPLNYLTCRFMPVWRLAGYSASRLQSLANETYYKCVRLLTLQITCRKSSRRTITAPQSRRIKIKRASASESERFRMKPAQNAGS